MGREYQVDELLDIVLRDRTFYSTSQGGVTLSGGEPLNQVGFVQEFASRCRSENLHLALDTTGHARPEIFRRVLENVDLVLFDLKLINPDEHRRLCGVPLDNILANLDQLAVAGLPVWVRTPVIPGCTDSSKNLQDIASHLKSRGLNLERFDLLAFSNYCSSKYEMFGRKFLLADTPLLTSKAMDQITRALKDQGLEMAQWSGPTKPEAS